MIMVSVLLWLGASVGNAALLVSLLNYIYAQPWHKAVLKASRAIVGALLFGWPILLWYVAGTGLAERLTLWWATKASVPLAAYVTICAVAGLLVWPTITVMRLARKRPGALLSNHTDFVDVRHELGYRPAGRGKYRPLMFLPGNEVYDVEFSVRTFRVPKLPAAWDGLSILHLSDFHFCGTPDRVFYEHVMDCCGDWDADLVAFTGDLLDRDRLCRWIKPVLGRVKPREGAFAILGNHDQQHVPWMSRRLLRKAGYCVLDNRWVQTTIRGEPLVVIGHEGPWFRPAPDLSDCPQEPFRLCLSHTPDNLAWARVNRVDLMLSGHTHGGQVRLPIVGSVFVPSKYCRKYDCGSFHEPPTLLHVSRGLAGKQPVRFGCRPEVTKVVLRCRA